MQQRLALAQALVVMPKVLLVDEPFGAIDHGIRADIHALLHQLWNERPLTIIMVNHDLSEAFTLATRVIVFERLRNEPSDNGRYGATVTHGIAIWRPRIAGAPMPSRFRPDEVSLAGVSRQFKEPSYERAPG
jgi:NitT/TauT family transport system ATP-binding protein